MSETRIIQPCDLQMVLEYLAKNLRIEVKTTNEYMGSMTDGPLYKDFHTLQLLLDGDVISEIPL